MLTKLGGCAGVLLAIGMICGAAAPFDTVPADVNIHIDGNK